MKKYLYSILISSDVKTNSLAVTTRSGHQACIKILLSAFTPEIKLIYKKVEGHEIHNPYKRCL